MLRVPKPLHLGTRVVTQDEQGEPSTEFLIFDDAEIIRKNFAALGWKVERHAYDGNVLFISRPLANPG